MLVYSDEYICVIDSYIIYAYIHIYIYVCMYVYVYIPQAIVDVHIKQFPSSFYHFPNELKIIT